MTLEINESQSKTPLHVPLTKWSTVSAVVPLVNDMYGLNADINLLDDRLSYKDKDGFLCIDFVETATGQLVWTFRDRFSIDKEQKHNNRMDNPKAFIYKKVIANFGIQINTEVELEFLKGMRKDVRYDSGKAGATKSSELMTLLNRYNIGDGWSSSPNSSNTTAYFIPRYWGPGADAPDVYNFNRDAKLLVVVELMLMGEYQTHALIVG